MHEWPEPPSIEECVNAKPATISATSSGKKEKNHHEYRQSNIQLR